MQKTFSCWDAVHDVWENALEKVNESAKVKNLGGEASKKHGPTVIEEALPPHKEDPHANPNKF